jgi:phosphate transport system permease protein
MTDATFSRQPSGRDARHKASTASAQLIARRYRSEAIFRGMGLGALACASLFLLFFLFTIVRQGIPAFFQNYATINVELKREDFDPGNTRDPKVIGAGNFDGAVTDAMRKLFPGVADRADRRALSNVLSSGAPVILRRAAVADPALVGGTHPISFPVDDLIDLYLKGSLGAVTRNPGRGDIALSGLRGQIDITATTNAFAAIVEIARVQTVSRLAAARTDLAGRQGVLSQQEQDLAGLQARLVTAPQAEQAFLEARMAESRKAVETARSEAATVSARIAQLETRLTASGQSETLDRELPSFFIRIGDGTVKLTSVTASGARGQIMTPPTADKAASGGWEIMQMETPEASRRLGDRELVFAETLREKGLIRLSISREFFLGGASREAELAGVGVAIVGSLITLLITLGLSFPIGVAAAIYLEEFAPKNRWTELIEVNINNLAAVPSIIFGLLGLAIFLNVFDLPRSAPVVGGLVLALMTLPIIIIASRAAIRAVPPSIKEAALGVGASHQQAVFHHVLPLAMPGILTGTILGMAHALGETAPLLMIGMVAFVVDYPKAFSDAATLLPVQIFMWADFPEAAFQQKTAAAIMVLLVFLVCMNLIAIILRKRFERRW